MNCALKIILATWLPQGFRFHKLIAYAGNEFHNSAYKYQRTTYVFMFYKFYVVLCRYRV